jgi:hypothetical protein
VRNIPFLIWNETSDELVPIIGVREQVKTFDALGYRYEFDEFHLGDHLALAINDEFGPAAAFLGSETLQPNPPHVTYAYNPTMDFPADGTAAGHAYWLSGVALRDSAGNPPIGTIDVRSHGFGVADPLSSATAPTAGALPPGNLGVLGYAGTRKTWGPAPAQPVADRVDVVAKDVKTVTIDPARARVDCNAQLNVSTDGPLTVTLTGCGTRSYR